MAVVPQKAWIWQPRFPNRHGPPVKKLNVHSGMRVSMRSRSEMAKFMTRVLDGVRSDLNLVKMLITIQLPVMATTPDW